MRADVHVSVPDSTGRDVEVTVACTNDWLLANLPPGAQVHVCVDGKKAMLLENYFR
jgi:hypothetical protein